MLMYESLDRDFNNDGTAASALDVDAYFSVLGDGACLHDVNGAPVECDDLDLNNDGTPGTQLDSEYWFWLIGTESDPRTLNDNRFLYRGYMWDPFLRVYHVRNRVYDPYIRRWLQPDPAGRIDGVNLYQYCGNDPWNGYDPYGLWGEELGSDLANSGSDVKVAAGYAIGMVGGYYEGAANGAANMVKGVAKAVVELGATAVDVWGTEIELIGTATGFDYRHQNKSELMKSTEIGNWDEMREQGQRNAEAVVISGITLGASDVVAGTVDYIKDGDDEKLSERMGPIVVTNLAGAAAGRIGGPAAAAEAAGSKAPGACTGPVRGSVADANWAQTKAGRSFSTEGAKKYSGFAGTSINTVDDLADALRTGKITPEQVPVDYVVVDGQKVILNSRTSRALLDADVPRSEWYGQDRTGQKVPDMDEITFDDLARRQTEKNKLPPTGTPNPPRGPNR